MARAHFADVLLGTSGSGALSLLDGATVHVYDQGTTNHIAQTIYAADSGGTTLSNPLTSDANGKVEFWLATAARVDLVASKTGYTTSTRTVDVEDAPSGGGVVPILTGDGAPTDGVTGAGLAAPGWTYIDTTGAAQYLQIGTLAVPVWRLLGAHGVRVLDAPTDGVTSEWTVTLDSGPAATRGHATVIVNVPGVAPEFIATVTLNLFAADWDDNWSANLQASAGKSQVSVVFALHGAHDPNAVLFIDALDDTAGRVNYGGNLNNPAGLTSLRVSIFTSDDGGPYAPPAGGHIEFWLG